MDVGYQWNWRKDAANAKKHDVTFAEAKSVFSDPLAITSYDADHSTSDEDRFRTVGQSEMGRILVVISTDIDDIIRIISARKATRTERQTYEN